MSKPGWQTTEHALSLLAIVLGAIMGSGILDSAPDNVSRICGAVVAILAALGYTAQRGYVKGVEAKAEAVKASVPPQP
jgi:hypothetical protein